MGKSNWIKDEDQKGNFSNDKQDTFDPKKRYIGVRLQQGVPLLDRDWNELEDIRRYEEQMLRKNYIGNGSPDNGFKISAAESPDDINNNFRISSGRFLVDGFDVVNEPPEQKPYINYIDQKQVDDLAPPTDEDQRDDTVYLDVWINEVRSPNTSEEVNDHENFDPSLGNKGDVNVETSVRHRLVWRVRVDQGSTGEYKNNNPNHHYYEIAKITRIRDQGKIEDKDIQDLRNVIGGLAQENWINATIGTGWENYEEQYNSASYFRDTNGIVHLRGSVKHDQGDNNTIFTLPEGYRPAKNEIQVVALSTGNDVSFSLCKISDNGEISHLGGSPGTKGIFLDGITFRAEFK